MATNNIMAALADDEKPTRTGVLPTGTVALLEQPFYAVLKEAKPEATRLEMVLNRLRMTFPFLDLIVTSPDASIRRPLSSVQPIDYYYITHQLLSLLDQLTATCMRADAACTVLVDYTLQEQLKRCFDESRRMAAEKFRYSEIDLACLERFRRKFPYSAHLVEDSHFPYKFDDGDGQLTDYGLVFFICLFLGKHATTCLLNEPDLLLFQEESEPARQVCCEVFTAYRPHLPKRHTNVGMNTAVLGWDMLAERSKCPAELYSLLSKTDRVSLVDTVDGYPRKRSADRFPPLILAYFDLTQAFRKIRFQVSMGKQTLQSYQKQTVDGAVQERVIRKSLNAFGRPHLLSDETTHVQYLLKGNKIGLYWEDAESKDAYLPTNTASGKPLNRQPLCWLSGYELAPMAFLQCLYVEAGCPEDVLTPEAIITEYTESYRRLFQNVATGQLLPQGHPAKASLTLSRNYNLRFTHIPKELQNYLSGKPVNIEEQFYQSADETVERMIKISKSQLNKVNQTERAMRGGRTSHMLNTEKMADFLAADFLALQPTQADGKDKLTGLNYHTLRSSLIHFNLYQSRLYGIFVRCRLVDSPIEHPFLACIPKEFYTDIVRFYKAYLREKIRYLSYCRDKQMYVDCYFLHVDRRKWDVHDHSYYRDLAARYLQQPIELPRGLFADAVKRLLSVHFAPSMPTLAAALQQEHCNVSYLIQSYCQASGAGEQPFYKWKRSYRLFNLLDGQYVDKRLEAQYYTVKEMEQRSRTLKGEMAEYCSQQFEQAIRSSRRVLNRKSYLSLQQNRLRHLVAEYTGTEKQLRLYQTQDRMLQLIGSHLLATAEAEDNNLTVRYPDGQTLSVRLNIALLSPEIYAQLRRIPRDNRLPSLSVYLAGKIVEPTALLQELETYDRYRILIVQLIQNIERNRISLSEADARRLAVIRQAIYADTYPAPPQMPDANHTWELPGIIEHTYRETLAMMGH
jgi:hypothetical protein